MAKYTTLNLKPETKSKLENLGKVVDTYDSVIDRLIRDAASWQIIKNELPESKINLIESRGAFSE